MDVEMLLWLGATRYYLGRMSYAVSAFTELLCANWSTLSEPLRKIIQRDVEDAFRQDDQERGGARRRGGDSCAPIYCLGHDCDRRSWETVRGLWEEQLRADSSAAPVANLDERGNLVYIGSEPPTALAYPGDSHA